jgi:recombinational DNA repair ATPase RecF
MSELDPEHRRLLVGLLADGGQALITATESAHVPSDEAVRIEVEAGSISTAPALRAA